MRPVELPRLDAPDAIFSWSLVSLSLRQFAILLLTAVFSINMWSFLDALGLGGILQWGMVLICLLIAVLFGWVRVCGHALEYLLLIMLRYYLRPRVAVAVYDEGDRQ